MLLQTASRTLRLATATGALVLLSAKAWAFEPGSTECIAPSGAGGGWDADLPPGRQGSAGPETDPRQHAGDQQGRCRRRRRVCRSRQQARLGQQPDRGRVVVDCHPIGAGRVLSSDYTMVRWLGSIGTDYGVIGVPPESPIKSLPELIAKVKADPTSVTFAGGSAVGGWDHLKVLIAAKKGGITNLRTVKYVAFDGGAEAITQLMAGKVNAFTGDASEAKGFVDAGKLRVLAVLAPERLSGEFGKFPTAKDKVWMSSGPIGGASMSRER